MLCILPAQLLRWGQCGQAWVLASAYFRTSTLEPLRALPSSVKFTRRSSAQADKRVLQEMAQCELRITGPPEPAWLATTPRAALLLQEALSVVELAHGLSEALHVAPCTLAELTHACRLPLCSTVLPSLYLALLRYCLLEVLQSEKPRARFPPFHIVGAACCGGCTRSACHRLRGCSARREEEPREAVGARRGRRHVARRLAPLPPRDARRAAHL